MRARSRLLAALFVVAAAFGLILWNANAQTAPAALGVGEAKEHALLSPGAAASVRGTVVEGSIVTDGNRVVSFAISDASEQLRVKYNQTPPDNFGVKEVVVAGRLAQAPDGTPLLEATAIQVGCSSKY